MAAATTVVVFVGIICQCLVSILAIIIFPILYNTIDCASNGTNNNNNALYSIIIWAIIQGLPSIILYTWSLAAVWFIPRFFFNLSEELPFHYVPAIRSTNADDGSYKPAYSTVTVTPPWKCSNSLRHHPRHLYQHQIWERQSLYSKLLNNNNNNNNNSNSNNNQYNFPIQDEGCHHDTNCYGEPLIENATWRDVSPRASRHVHGLIDRNDYLRHCVLENRLAISVMLFAPIAVLFYLAWLSWGTYLYSQHHDVICPTNNHMSKSIFAFIIIYWITPLWFPIYWILWKIHRFL